MRIDRRQFAYRFLRKDRGRIGLTMAGLGLAVALISGVDQATRAIRESLTTTAMVLSGRATYVISARDGVSHLPASLIVQAEQVPGVLAVAPVVVGSAFAQDLPDEPILTLAIDPSRDRNIRNLAVRDSSDIRVAEPWNLLRLPNSILLPEPLATRLGARVGDPITLDVRTGRRVFSVVGILEPEGAALAQDGRVIVLGIDSAPSTSGEAGWVTRVDVVTTGDPATRSRLERVVAADMVIQTPAEKAWQLEQALSSLAVLLRCLSLIGLPVAGLVAFSGMSSAFARRAHDILVLRAVGMRRSRIWTLQLQELFFIASVGTVAGLASGAMLAKAAFPLLASATSLHYKVPVSASTSNLRAVTLALGGSLGVATIFVAAALAAWAALNGRRRALSQTAPLTAWPGWESTAPLGIVLAVATLAAVSTWLEAQTGQVGFGVVASTAIVLCAALAAYPTVDLARPLLERCLLRIAGPPGRFAASALRRDRRRTGLAVALIAAGATVVLWLATLEHSFETSVTSALGTAIRADLVVTSTNVESGYLEAPMGDQLVSAVAAVPGVASVAGWRALEIAHQGVVVGLSGYDPRFYRDSRLGGWPLIEFVGVNPWERVARGEAVVVSTSFAETFGQRPGDHLTLESPDGTLEIPIVGTTVDFVSARGTIEMSRELLENYWRDHEVTRIFVAGDGSRPMQTLRDQIIAGPGSRQNLRVQTTPQLLEYFGGKVRAAFSVLPLMAAVVILLVIAGYADSRAVSAREAKPEILLASAIGLSAGDQRVSAVIEGVTIGVLGLSIAVVAGSALSTLWIRQTFRRLLGWVIEVHVPVVEFAGLTIVILGGCGLIALIPARRLTRVRPIEVAQ